jgi:hydroxyacylglutathione hydrolase
MIECVALTGLPGAGRPAGMPCSYHCMRIERWTGPPVDTHSYLVVPGSGASAWVVDAPLGTATRVLAAARSLGLQLERVILTHAHFDHLLDAGRYASAGVPVALHPADFPLLRYPQPAMMGFPHPMPELSPEELPAERDLLRLGDAEWEVWHLPGHSPGHVALYAPEHAVLLGGDVLFQGGFGRVDLPGSDARAMAASLRRLLSLPDLTRVYPGHGPETTIGAERAWLAPLLEQQGALLTP